MDHIGKREAIIGHCYTPSEFVRTAAARGASNQPCRRGWE